MATADKKTAKGADAPQNTNTGLSAPGAYVWTVDKVDEDSGEVIQVPKYKYTHGSPREYRFDAKNGGFTVGANSPVGDKLKIQPIAWAIYTDALFGQDSKLWAEVYFIDAKNCLSVIMFHGSSAQELQKLSEPLYYDEKGLNDVIIEVYSTKHTNKNIKPAADYHIARFDKYEEADPELVKEYKALTKLVPVFRKTSWTPNREVISQKFYYDQAAHSEDDAAELGTGAELAE